MAKQRQAYIPTSLELEGILAITREDNLQRWVMLHLSYYAGLRSKEIGLLDVGDVFDGKEIPKMAKVETKGGGSRRISLVNEKLRSALTTWYEVQNLSAKPTTAPLFCNPQGARFNANSVVKQFAKAYLKPNEGRKVENRLTSHSGRRYFATKLGNTPGITTKQMMALGGWESPDVAMRYVEVNEEQLDDLVARATL